MYDAGSWAVFTNIYQNLLTFEPGSPAPTPDAAESCAFTSAALTTYRCELRDGLTFSNGTPSRRRRWSIRSSAFCASAIPWGRDRCSRISFPWTPGVPRGVPSRERGRHLAVENRHGARAIVDPAEFPADRLREEKSASGSGPYVIASYTAEKSLTLKPNAAYDGAVTKRGVAVEVHYFETSRHVEEAWNARTVDIAYAGLPAAALAGIDPGAPTYASPPGTAPRRTTSC
ncbi:peptide-binding protein [Streptomyces badius]